MFLNRKAIAEILDMEWISNDQEHVYTVLAKIVGIDHDGFENYTVVKIFEVDDTLEAKFCGFSSDKGVESKGKRIATTMIAEQNDEGESSGDHVTPEKESGQMKKIKNMK
ncbi:hypothetical protein L2E82_21707 [Cichorium intybus]|uniref:Uncharacterized protein n=1 Tax=Cichorium intybus TaxID=13427 RepID=A0ACB9DWK8_CICIN|nr:hypothetical protein L2E82_21707 [Cichorium intybus]